MGDPFEDKPVPRWTLITAGVVIAITITVAATARYGGYDPGAERRSPVVASEDVALVVQPDGSISVLKGSLPGPISLVPPDQSGFLRGILTSLERERRRRDLPLGAPYRLVRHENGRLALTDPGTGMDIDVGSFGPTSTGVVNGLFEAAKARD